MFWAGTHIFGGIFLLIIAFRPEWVSGNLKNELSRRPKHVKAIKWGGSALLGLGGVRLLAALFGIL